MLHMSICYYTYQIGETRGNNEKFICKSPSFDIFKRPKGPHIVHLSTMCHLFDRNQGSNFCILINPKNTNLVEDIEILLSVKIVEFCSALSEKKSKMSQPIRGWSSHLFYPIGLKNTNLVEDVEILLPVKSHWIPFNSFRGEVENVSVNQRPELPSCFSDQPEKHKLGRGLCFLSSFVEFHSVVSEEKLKISQPIRGQGVYFVFPIIPKNENFVKDVEILLHVKFRRIPFSGFRGEVENAFANQRPRQPSCVFLIAPKTQTWYRMLRSCFLSCFVEFRSAVSEEKSKMSQPIRGQSGHLVFPIGQKNTSLVEDVEILLHVKFCWIPFSGCRGEVEYVS